MATTDVQMLQDGLRRGRRKLTRPRQAVLDTIAEADTCLSPAEVYRRAKARYPRLGLTTVYRTLELLADLGYLQRVHGDGGCHSYAAVQRHHSHHLLCSCCGRTEEFACGSLDPLVEALQATTGFHIEGHILEMIGVCPSCRERKGQG
ncbi:MAG TPA: Fur family transcriptional regulator [Anaerolineae bacterium]|nr:Fur family transcriptional regulator [Anaerolineae bacterium]HPL28295.1 Fur family transcriptional regulator [Anaerolineae bacterium]